MKKILTEQLIKEALLVETTYQDGINQIEIIKEQYNSFKTIEEGLFDGIKSAYQKLKNDKPEAAKKVAVGWQKAKDYVKNSVSDVVNDLDNYAQDLKVAYDGGNLDELKAKVKELFGQANRLHARIRKAEKYQRALQKQAIEFTVTN